ncbi:MAG: metallophosphoesterase [Pirellulaceae bacterium]
MKLGIITDVHESVENLQAALKRLDEVNVERIISIGDFSETGSRLEETCEALLAAGVEGVWGNHDFGICEDARKGVQLKFGSAVAEFAKRQQPELWVDDCLFMHVEPWLDPESLTDLWYLDGLADNEKKRSRIFGRRDFRIAFSGHFHTWFAASEQGMIDWNGQAEIVLGDSRYFVVIDACLNGAYALFDTETQALTPSSIDRESYTDQS